jgi:hypothetical protein
MFETYRPSGQYGVLTVVLFVLSLIPAAILAFVYQLALEWIPFIDLNFLMTLGVGLFCGWLMTTAIKRGHCRNVLLATSMSLVLCCWTLAAKHWFQYESFLSEATSIVAQENNVPGTQRDIRSTKRCSNGPTRKHGRCISLHRAHDRDDEQDR